MISDMGPEVDDVRLFKFAESFKSLCDAKGIGHRKVKMYYINFHCLYRINLLIPFQLLLIKMAKVEVLVF